ncbi:MAG TPA: hypothetical protein VMK13_03220 [Streptosporangiaceae bacterium]|nr:hypothetical protein [Streptosporangiaceae bacterium]
MAGMRQRDGEPGVVDLVEQLAVEITGSGVNSAARPLLGAARGWGGSGHWRERPAGGNIVE